ncbi:hypothetical protein [Spiroplasma ixodetis]|nr:hypothetical protein [Spiroplasma ixodetis]
MNKYENIYEEHLKHISKLQNIMFIYMPKKLHINSTRYLTFETVMLCFI